MKQLIYLFLLFLSGLAAFSCAKQSSPMGGPRDEDPPLLIESLPKDQSVNTKPERIVLTFDEFVGLDNPGKGVVITPKVNKDLVEFTALKNSITVLLKQDLEDSTTYVLDFQKSVVDISERNPAENLRLVFSTGSQIDSLNISGQLRFPFSESKEDYKNVLVGIYPLNDSTDVFSAPPYYLAQVDTLGKFSLKNLKSGHYRAYAWKDVNGNLKADYKSEEYDFLPDTISLTPETTDSLFFNLTKADLTPIKILRSSNFGKNFDIILNRNPLLNEVENDLLGKDLFYVQGEKRLRFFPKKPILDSIPIKISLQDSVGFSSDSLIWAKFPDSGRKPEKLDIQINSGKSFYQDLDIQLTFNKPVNQINLDSLQLKIDSLFIPIQKHMLSFVDSSKRDVLHIKAFLADSLQTELVTLIAPDSTFQDIEGEYNEKKVEANYRKLVRKNLADGISGEVIGTEGPLIIQLINGKKEITYQQVLDTKTKFSFSLLDPGTYTLRVIEDSNGNGIWDPSNYMQRKLAERVFYYKGEDQTRDLIIRGGWTIEDLLISATPATGLHKNEK
ncbi:MAG: Ig-like domain-containing protein [Algoriphagus sp.]|uniref:Ig-like domain-containing protein n=1 Tax=Algoriphagus sp. TaxID=1872435 RepID=UPI00274D2174|nr:Ig-like domain-containing protein [Algoriphagus sp.]MDP4904941.1 Ig-like domain-containing protein [Algoriphagus sp.]MDP4956440.1 Ig-like domain-containing protein [Algoriphagus sp.]MDP5126201.1 Ig-like domain-containing protein [Algoriphagus sp.]